MPGENMAILLAGNTSCAICGNRIDRGDDAVLFPQVVLNERDPLHALSDASCHAACVSADPRGPAMLAAAEAYASNTGPGKRACAACGGDITDPDDYFMIAWLGDPSADPLGRFNYTHLHTSHIRDWKQADAFLALAKAAVEGGRWQGDALPKLVRDIEAGRAS
jgi:hypothetical protein